MGGKILEIEDLVMSSRTGVVLECRVWSETHVSGGSAEQTSHVGPQGGHVTTPGVRITSSTQEKMQLFIRDDEGREFDRRFNNAGLAVREGHRVSIVFVPDEDGQAMALVNHTTGKSRVYDNRISDLVGSPPAPPLLRLVGFIYMLALLPLHILTYVLGFNGQFDHFDGVFGRMGGFVEWLFWNLVLIGGMPALSLLAPKVRPGLREDVAAALKARVDELMRSEAASASAA